MIYRLRGDDLRSWPLYPAFEYRVLDFAKQSGIPIDMERAALDLRARFVNMPLAAGYWLSDHARSSDLMTGHVCAWLTINLGVLCIFFFQAEGHFTEDQRQEWVDDCRAWMDEIDSMRGKLPYIPAGPPISCCEFVTPHSPEVWTRYLERMGFETPETRTLIKFRRKPLPLRDVALNGAVR